MTASAVPDDRQVVQMTFQDPRTRAAANNWPVYDHSNRRMAQISQPLLDGTRVSAQFISDAYLYLARLDNHFLLPGGLVTDGGNQLFAHGLTYHLRRDRQDLGIVDYTGDAAPVRVAVPQRQRRIEGPAIALVGSSNFGHMLFEFLPRLYCMTFAPGLEDVPVIVTADMPERFIEFLEIGGIRRERLIFQDSAEMLQVEQLWVPSVSFGRGSSSGALYFSMPALNYLRERFYRPFRRDAREPRTRVYLNRAGASFRRLVNEAEILPVLEQNGFTTMDGIGQSAREQLELIANAEAVFSQIGSSPTITMFAPPDAYIVETCPQDVAGRFVGIAWAALLTQPYYRITGERVVLPDNDRTPPLYHDYRVDPAEVAKAIAMMKFAPRFAVF